jgi:hypothetical protein
MNEAYGRAMPRERTCGETLTVLEEGHEFVKLLMQVHLASLHTVCCRSDAMTLVQQRRIGGRAPYRHREQDFQ